MGTLSVRRIVYKRSKFAREQEITSAKLWQMADAESRTMGLTRAERIEYRRDKYETLMARHGLEASSG